MNWKKVLTWASLNFGLLALFVFGETTGAAWASNISVFIMWVMVAISFVIIFAIDDIVKSTLEKKPDYEFSTPEWMDVAFDVIMLSTLVGFGYFWLAAGYLFHIFVISVYRGKIIEQLATDTEEPLETS